MSWVYNGRKYWYHKGKKYSCKFKKRYKSKRSVLNFRSTSSFEYEPIPGSGSRYSVIVEFKPDGISDERIQTWQFDSIEETKKSLNTLHHRYKDEIISIQGYDHETNESI